MVDTELSQDIGASEIERTLAVEHFYMIRPFLEDGVPLAQIARERAIPRRTLTRWVKQYRETGLGGLIRQERASKGERRNMSPDLKLLIEGLALEKPRYSRAVIHRQATRVAREQGWSVPSYSQVSSIIDALDPGLVVLAHQGSKAYREQFDLLYRFEAEAPYHLWQAEHTLLRIWVLTERENSNRPWLSAILDNHSRAIAGYFLGFQDPTALQTALTLRQAIGRKDEPRWHVCSIPRVFYTNHGSDFTSRHMEQKVRFILEHKWQQIGVRLQPDDFSDMEAAATVIRITAGIFRLIHRLCTQIERILAAREQSVIGQM